MVGNLHIPLFVSGLNCKPVINHGSELPTGHPTISMSLVAVVYHYLLFSLLSRSRRSKKLSSHGVKELQCCLLWMNHPRLGTISRSWFLERHMADDVVP